LDNQTFKKRFSYKDIIYKGKRLAALCLIVVFGAGVALTSTVNNEIPVHDGDVLVDSLAVTEHPSENNGENIAGTDFETLRAEKELERNKLISSLDNTINNSKNENEKNNASKEKNRLLEYAEKEADVEGLIRSKNLPESYVVITQSSISITVDKQDLDLNTVTKICDIAMRETGRSADKIVVQSKY